MKKVMLFVSFLCCALSGCSQNFPVTVDYTQSLQEMYAAGRYDKVYVDIDKEYRYITGEHFSSMGSGTENVNLRLVHFNREVTSAEAEDHIRAQGLEPAKLEHILAFGATYPEKHREFRTIVSLGSSWVDPRGGRRVPYLNMAVDVGRKFVFAYDGPGHTWEDDPHFLAVSK